MDLKTIFFSFVRGCSVNNRETHLTK